MVAWDQASLWAAVFAAFATFALGRIAYALSTVGHPRPRRNASGLAKAMIVLGSGDSRALNLDPCKSAIAETAHVCIFFFEIGKGGIPRHNVFPRARDL